MLIDLCLDGVFNERLQKEAEHLQAFIFKKNIIQSYNLKICIRQIIKTLKEELRLKVLKKQNIFPLRGTVILLSPKIMSKFKFRFEWKGDE